MCVKFCMVDLHVIPVGSAEFREDGSTNIRVWLKSVNEVCT
jgi:hypothetical protein